MAKIIVERPRHGHAMGRVRPGRFAPLEDSDGAPLRAYAPKRDRVFKTKTLNENLAPLKRFLRAQINRPWNKVFSEISAHLRPTSTVQQHVIDHIQDFVAFRTRMRDGKVVTSGRRWSGAETPLERDYRELYVHPRTGLLLRNPYWNKAPRSYADKRAARGPVVRRLDAFRAAVFMKGQWHDARLEPVPQDIRKGVEGEGARVIVGPFRDAVFGDAWSRDLARDRYGRDDVFAETLRLFSAAERKALGLP